MNKAALSTHSIKLLIKSIWIYSRNRIKMKGILLLAGQFIVDCAHIKVH